MSTSWLDHGEEFEVVELPEGADHWRPDDEGEGEHSWPVEVVAVEDAPSPKEELSERIRRVARQRGANVVAVSDLIEEEIPPGKQWIGGNRYAINAVTIQRHSCYAAFGKSNVDWLREDLLAFSQSANEKIADLVTRVLERLDEYEKVGGRT